MSLKFNCTLHSRSEFLRYRKLQKSDKIFSSKSQKMMKMMYIYLYDRDVALGCLSNLTFGQEKDILNFT